jgi:hypothetical protein
LARRLIALEASRAEPPGAPAGGAVRACDRLREPLARLAGVAGFRSLLSRALAMAKAEVVSLNPVQVREDGSLEGFDGGGDGPDGDGGAALVANLLGLLGTFIGERLMRQLVLDAWPEVATDEGDGRVGGRS